MMQLPNKWTRRAAPAALAALGWLLVGLPSLAKDAPSETPEAAAVPQQDADEQDADEHGDWTCVPEGRDCTFDSDCCDNNCVSDPKLGKVCKPQGGSWTCTPEGRACTFDSDCCSKNCINDPKLGKVCKPAGASWTCIPQGRKCNFDSDCCSNKCTSDPKLGKVCKPKS